MVVYFVLFIPILSNFSSWSGYKDELVWAAIWMYKATGDETYLAKATSMYDEFEMDGLAGIFSWDDKSAGVHALLAAEPGGDVSR